MRPASIRNMPVHCQLIRRSSQNHITGLRVDGDFVGATKNVCIGGQVFGFQDTEAPSNPVDVPDRPGDWIEHNADAHRNRRIRQD
jgi:hypothetical protein